MRSAVTAALGERQMLMLVRIVNAFGRKTLNWLGQVLRVVRHLRFLDFFPANVEHRLIAFDELPLEGSLGSVNVETLRVLALSAEEKARDFEAEVLVAHMEVGRFEGKRRT